MPTTVEGVLDNGSIKDIEVASWNGSDSITAKIGTKVVSGAFIDPLPIYLENPQNRTPKCFVTVVEPQAKILSAEQVFDASGASTKARAKTEVGIPGYVEHKYQVTIQHADGSITKDIISMFMER